MKYLGGKYRVATEISDYINSVIGKEQPYWEPFVGAAWILRKVKATRRFASDINPYLISMWNAALNGWIPPENISEDEYKAIKENKGNYPPELVAFTGFATSFGGKWFGGYARNADPGRNYAREGSRSILRALPGIAGTEFFAANFLETEPPASAAMIYCDPPYNDMTRYDYAPTFDHEAFWDRVRELESAGHNVIVSEYEAPSDFQVVLEIGTKTDLRIANGKKGGRVERVFSMSPMDERIKQLKMF